MSKNQPVKATDRSKCEGCKYREYLSGYKLYKEFKKKCEVNADEENPDVFQ